MPVTKGWEYCKLHSQNVTVYLLDSGVCRTKTALHCDGETSACISSLGPPTQGA